VRISRKAAHALQAALCIDVQETLNQQAFVPTRQPRDGLGCKPHPERLHNARNNAGFLARRIFDAGLYP
jgi:hypothetical protein